MTAKSRQYELVMDSPVGSIGIRLRDGAVTCIDFLARRRPARGSQDAFAVRVQHEIEAWFSDPHSGFSIPVRLTGTPYQQRVWQALQAIPAGEYRTYGALAAELGSGARAVGNACRRNPVSLIVPCHRVVGVNGMGGYGGRTGDRAIWRKHWLLGHEGARCPGLKPVNTPRYQSVSTQPHGDLHV